MGKQIGELRGHVSELKQEIVNGRRQQATVTVTVEGGEDIILPAPAWLTSMLSKPIRIVFEVDED